MCKIHFVSHKWPGQGNIVGFVSWGNMILVRSVFVLLVALAFQSTSEAKLSKSCKNLLRLAKADPRTSRAIAFNQRDNLALEDYKLRSEQDQKDRRDLVSIAKEDTLRKQVVRAALADLRRKSNVLESELKLNKSNIVDVLGVGMGIHMSIASNTLSRARPDLRFLIVEESDLVASTFAKGAIFQLNSPNRPSVGGTEKKLGKGNLNELINGIVQVPDLSAQKYPPAQTLADAATLNQSVNSSEVLFNYRVTRVEDRLSVFSNWPARYRVTLTQAETSQEVIVYANVIIDGGGLGVPKVLRQIQPEYESQREQSLIDKSFMPDITTTEDARTRFSNSKTPLREYSDKVVAIVGGGPRSGDSSKVFIELLDRLEDGAYYGKDKAQIRNARKIVWIGADIEDCLNFVSNAKVRYAGIAGGLKKFFSGVVDKGEIQPVPGRLTRVKRLKNQQWKLEVTRQDGSTTTQVVDKVIFGTGYDSNAAEKYTSLLDRDHNGVPFNGDNPLSRSEVLQRIEGKIDGVTTLVSKRLSIPANQRRTEVSQEIYFVGSGFVLADPQDLVGLQVNRLAIALLGPKTAALAALIAESAQALNSEKPDYSPITRIPFLSENVKASSPRMTLRSRANYNEAEPYDELYLTAKFFGILKEFSFETDDEYQFEVKRFRSGYFVTESKGIAKVTYDTLSLQMQQDTDFIDLLDSLIGAGSPRSSVNLRFRSNKRGNIIFDSLYLSFEK